jgi:hypothetical protein
MDNFDLNINNYTQDDLYDVFDLNNGYSHDELNSKISKTILNVINKNHTKEYKQKMLLFINSAKDRLQIKDNLDNNNSKILSEIIDTKIGDIIKTYNNFNHNPLQHQRVKTTTINPYQEKTVTINYIFNTQFRNDFLNSIPQQCVFNLPEPINNVVQLKLLSIQIPNVMLAFSNSRFTTQIYIKEDVTNYAAIVVIPEGNYDEITFPAILTKCINEQVISPFILPVNYRFTVTIDPYTFFVTIKNSLYTFTMETITKHPSSLGKCNLDNQLSSSNLTVYQVYNTTVEKDSEFAGVSSSVDIDYNTKNVISDFVLEDCIFNVKKYYSEPLYKNLLRISFTLKSLMKGTLVLDYDLNKMLDIFFDSNKTDVLYIPLENFETGGVSTDFTGTLPRRPDEYFYRHISLMTGNLLKRQVAPISTHTNSSGVSNDTRRHIYTLKIYKDKKFELIQDVTGMMDTTLGFYKDFKIYDNLDEWTVHNTTVDSIGYNPVSLYNTSSGPYPIKLNNYISNSYIKEYDLYQMMTGELIMSHDSTNNYKINIQIVMKHNPYVSLFTFPNSTISTQIQSELDEKTELSSIQECKAKKSNLSEVYNYRFNDLDVKGKVSETSISNTLGYQIGYRSIVYTGLKSYTSESAFDKTSLDYVYFSVDDYNNGYLNHNYGVLPNANILDKNLLAIIPIRSPQFTTTFDNGSDYIPKLRQYLTPVNIKKIGVKLLDPLGNLVNINTNDYSFVLEVTKILEITNNK